MTRPTKERLEEIRDLAKKPERPVYRELLAEIDALEKERDEAIDLVYETCDFLDPRTKKSIHDLIKERDRLREALAEIAKQDTSSTSPDILWLTNWRNNTKMLAQKALGINGHLAQAAPRCKHDIHGNDCVKCYPSEVK